LGSTVDSPAKPWARYRKEKKMGEAKRKKLKDRYVFVKDRDGNEYVCKVDALKNPDELTEEEKAACFEASPWTPH
jgi:hypothetical protein